MRLIHLADVAVGNSKTFVVPAGHVYELKYAYVVLTISGAGSRSIDINVLNASAVAVLQLKHGDSTVDATSSTVFAPAEFHGTGTLQLQYTRPIPEQFFISAGYTIKVFDSLNFAAGDTVAVNLFILDHLDNAVQ